MVAAAVGLVVALLAYAPASRGRPAFAGLAAARGLAVALVTAVAVGAPLPGGARRAGFVAVDASASWTRGAGDAGGRAARDSAARLALGARDRVLAFGESLRVAGPRDGVPADRRTAVAAAAESAAASGVPLTLVTDGEVDDPESLARAPAGSRAIVAPPRRGADAAVADVSAPATAAPGETVAVAVRVVADAAGAPAGRVAVRLDATAAVARPFPALGAYGQTTVDVPLVVPAGDRSRIGVLTAVVAVPGDREVRNDSASRAVEITAAPRAVVVSTAPDYDVGLATSVLRGALGVPVRAFYRVAPGTWRLASTLAPASESEVRAAAAAAALLVVHGDTAALGAPRRIGRGAVALLPVGDTGDSTTDWYASAAGNPGPLAAIRGLSWDSLPPVDVPTTGGDAAAPLARLPDRWTAVLAHAGRSGPTRAVVSGGTEPSGRRIAIVTAGGLWRWAFRGGVGAVAAPAVWGALFDWLADAPPATSAVLAPLDAGVRSGAQVRWRGLAPRDSVAVVQLTSRRGGRASALTVRRDAESGEATSDSPAPGVYDVHGGGVLVVNASAELLPRRAALRSGPIGAAVSVAMTAPAPIAPGWPLAAATLLLCGEWVARRRLGLR